MAVKVGDKVTCSAEYDFNGTHLASFVRTNTYDVIQVGGKSSPSNRVVIGKGKAVTAAVDVKYLTVIGATIPEPPTPTAPPATVLKQISGGSDKLAAKIIKNAGNFSVSKLSVNKIDDKAVQYQNKNYDATKTSDYDYTINKIIENRNKNSLSPEENMALSRSDPKYVQNLASFPPIKKFDSKAGYYRYNYYMDYDTQKASNDRPISADFPAMRKASNLDIMNRETLNKYYSKYYNKYKLDNPNDHLSKTFAHVFFVRPDCNIFKDGSSSVLNSDVDNMSEFYYAKKHSPDVLRQLSVRNGGYDHEFMMYLSNKVRSFEIQDEYINSDTYGQGLTGYKIPYGKHNVESRTAGKFSIRYVDTRDLYIYNIHKLWIDYISYVYRGKLTPRDEYIKAKILDYPTCVYYILCAEDGETIIFWTKYWGVFPLDAPSSAFSYSADNGNTVHDPELNISYQYAWKEDFNPFAMIEFNEHSKKNNYKYINSYQNAKAGTGYTWGGAPFIETFAGKDGVLPYTFKLRFRPI